MVATDVQMPNPTTEQLAEIRSLWPEKTENTAGLTSPYALLHGYLTEELGLKLNGAHDQAVYTAGWSILWTARRRHLAEIESTLETAVELRQSGEGGGHAALRQALARLGYTVSSSLEAEQLACQVINGKL